MITKIKWHKLFFWILGFFLILNIGALLFLWQGRQVPPEPDDSGIFLGLINTYSKYGSIFSQNVKVFNTPFMWDETGGVDRSNYFSWAFFWGKTAKLLSLTPSLTFELSFIFGILFFLVSVLYFFKEENWQFKTILLLTLAFFTGDGAYHGFYWPSPALYSVSSFLIIFKIINNKKKHWLIKIIILLPVFLLLHPLSLVASFSLFIIFIINLFKKDKELNNSKFIITFIFVLIIYFIWIKFLNYQKVNLISINGNLIYFVVNKLLTRKIFLLKEPALIIFSKYYLWLLTKPFFISFFIIGIIELWKRNIFLLKLYVSFVLLTILGLFFYGGEKILLYVWIFTFFIFSYGINFLFTLLTGYWKKTNITHKNKLFYLLLINLGLCFLWSLSQINIQNNKDKILNVFYIMMVCFLGFYILLKMILGKKILIEILVIFTFINFFGNLLFEKIAMTLFIRNKDNFSFNKNIFFKAIDPNKEGLIIYNDNLSFSLFVGNGLLEREAVKKGYLKKGDINKAAYFIATKPRFKGCNYHGGTCWLSENGEERQMKEKIIDSKILLYEF